jgi:hypothetical protein
MLKIIGIVILALGAAFGIPSVREKISPVLAPVTNRFGGVGDKMGEPAKKWAAKNEANVLLRKLAQEHSMGKELPTPLNFITWVKTNTKAGKRGMDPWGRPYYLIRGATVITVGSPGPDRTRNTADDVRATAPAP